MAIGVLSSNSRRLYEEYRKSLSSSEENGNFQWLNTVAGQSQYGSGKEASTLKASPPVYYSKGMEVISQIIQDSTEAMSKFSDFTRTTFTSSDPTMMNWVFHTYYSEEKIVCIQEGRRAVANPEEKLTADELEWEIQLNSPSQYYKLKEFLETFPQEDNLVFTANETFWKDFLNDEIDMEGFMDFYAWTNHGVPNFGMGENGEPVGLNQERIKNPIAQYFNNQHWIANVWTEEEMWEMLWNGDVKAEWIGNGQSSIPVGGAVTTENQIRFAGALGSKNTYFKYADELGVISYKSATFYCDTETDTLKLGDCSNPANCIQIALTDGGYLMVNRDNIDQLLDAITFFSPADQALILRAIQQERMKKSNLTQMEREKDKVLELVRNREEDEKKKTVEDNQ
ncbi:MAG: hypothetical protein IJP31_01030 [Lachnospiraceae bacterium]|nr:hypothetical protein [Lachnospiraceae bacterium]